MSESLGPDEDLGGCLEEDRWVEDAEPAVSSALIHDRAGFLLAGVEEIVYFDGGVFFPIQSFSTICRITSKLYSPSSSWYFFSIKRPPPLRL